MTPLFRIALRNVLRNRRRSLVSFVAVFLSLSVMVTLRGCVNGMAQSVRDSVVLGQTGALQVHRRGFGNSLGGSSLDLDVPADQAFLARILRVPHVTAASPRIGFGAMVNAHDTTTAALFLAIDPTLELRVCPLRAEMVSAGRPLASSNGGGSIIAAEVARSLGIHLGERATLMANDRDGVLNAVETEYTGTFGQAGMPLPDKKIGFVPVALAQELLRMPGRATEIVVAVDDLENVTRTRALLQTELGSEFEVTTWHDVAPWVDTAVATYHIVLNSLSFIFLFVALLGVVNTMLMSVLERTREVGTMMAIGVRRLQVLALFLIEAAFLGLLGGVLGATTGSAVVGYLGARGIHLRMGGMASPMRIVPWLDSSYLVFILLLSVLGVVLAALGPALRASRMRPASALTSN